MDMIPPDFWEMPAEIRRIDNCTSESPCLKRASDSEHHIEHEHVPEGVVVRPLPATARATAALEL